jgi:hypothetical protein
LTEIINLCDDDNKEEEKEEIDNPINIDDTIAFPSLSPPSSPSASPTERPQKITDTKRTPSKLDNRSSTTASLTRLPLPSKAVLLSQKDEAKSGSSSLKQSKLSFNRNGNISLKINSHAIPRVKRTRQA